MSDDNTANQTLEDGAQDTATQTAEDSAQQAATQTDQDGADRESEGLKQAAVAEKKKRQELEAQLLAIQTENAVLKQQATQVVAPSQTAQPESTYARAVKELGLQDETWLTTEQQAKVFARKEQLDQQNQQQFMRMTVDTQFMASHPDYGDVVGRMNPVTGAFIPSEELQRILMTKPYLSVVAQSGAQAAYELVVQERQLAELKRLQSTLSEQDTRQNIDALTAPMSPAAASGGDLTGMGLNTAEEVARMEARVKAGEFDK